MGIGTFWKKILLLFVLVLANCSSLIEIPTEINLTQCQPGEPFQPTSAKITLAGNVIFSNKKTDHYFNLPDASWTCAIPNSSVVSLFKGEDALTLIRAVSQKKNNTQDVLTTRLDFIAGSNFRSFVNDHCATLGLSYLFEINSTKDEVVYGCQINPQVLSAIMWKRTANAMFVELAYLPFYQPFVDRLSQVN